MEKNTNGPLSLKYKVLDATLMYAMLYGSEAWISRNNASILHHSPDAHAGGT